jgi:hypothetical protein
MPEPRSSRDGPESDQNNDMMVTGVQPAGAKGMGTLQAAGVDAKDLARSTAPAADDRDEHVPFARSGTAQPVVFPRAGVPLDQRPVSRRMHEARRRYHADGGNTPDRG